MKTITKHAYEEIKFLKETYDGMKGLQENLYNLSLKELDIQEKDDSWWFEYFYNDTGDIFEALEKVRDEEQHNVD